MGYTTINGACTNHDPITEDSSSFTIKEGATLGELAIKEEASQEVVIQALEQIDIDAGYSEYNDGFIAKTESGTQYLNEGSISKIKLDQAIFAIRNSGLIIPPSQSARGDQLNFWLAQVGNDDSSAQFELTNIASQALTDSDPVFRAQVFNSLDFIESSPRKLQICIQALKNQDPNVLRAALIELSDDPLFTPTAAMPVIPDLTEVIFLQRKNSDIIFYATKILGNMGPAAGKTAAPKLAKFLIIDGVSTQGYFNIIGALAKMGSTAKVAVPELLETMCRWGVGFNVQEYAAEALGKIGAEVEYKADYDSAVSAMIAGLEDDDAGTVILAANCLGYMGRASAAALPALDAKIRAANSNYNVVTAASSAAQKIRTALKTN